MKKFLSLVLALVMTMSLVTISAGAKDFTDNSKITYDEAVAVVSEIGVVDGYKDGAFNPQNTLTRGAAAKIICNLILSPTTASALTADAAPFKDVPVNHEFAGYIAYCSQQGIINGYADGTFRPAGTLNGYAFMKMLLGALGYDGEVEGFTGPNWTVNVAKLALGVGLDDGNDEFAGNNPVNREEACLYAFNTLKADMVQYDSKTTVSVGGADVVISGSKAQKIKQEDSGYVDTMGDSAKVLQFCEKYFPKLTKTKNDTDPFGRPAAEWKYKSNVIGSYADLSDLIGSWTAKAPKSEMFNLVGSSIVGELQTDPAKDYSFTVYVDGEQLDGKNGTKLADPDTYFEKNNTSAAGTKNAVGRGNNVGMSGNGVLTELYMDDDNNVTVVMVNTYLVQATADYNSTKESITVEAIDTDETSKDGYVNMTLPTGMDTSIDQDDFDVSGVKEDDYLLVTWSVSEDEYESVEPATLKTGTVSQYTERDSVVLDGETLKYSRLTGDTEQEEQFSINSEASLVLDAYGYILYVDDANSTSSYVFVNGIQGKTNLNKDAVGDAYFTDGTAGEISIKKLYTQSGADYDSGKTIIANGQPGWYTFTKDGNDNYTLTAVKGYVNTTKRYEDSASYDQAAAATTPVVLSSRVNFLAGSVRGEDSKIAPKANSKTIFMTLDSDDELDVYTGVSNAPDVTLSQGSTKDAAVVTYVMDTNGYAKYVFIDVSKDAGAVIDGANNIADYMLVLWDNGKRTFVEGDEYRQYKVIIDGEETTRYIAESLVGSDNRATGMVFYDIKTNNKDYITDSTKVFKDTAQHHGTGTKAEHVILPLIDDTITQKSGSISFGNDAYLVDSNTEVYMAVSASALLKNKGNDYESYVKTTIGTIAGLCTNYAVTGTAYVVLDDDYNKTDRADYLFVYITGAEKEDDNRVSTPSVSIAAPTGTDLDFAKGDTISVLLTATADWGLNEGTTKTYQWYKDDAAVGTDSNTYTATAAGKYTVKVTQSKTVDGSPVSASATSNAITINQSEDAALKDITVTGPTKTTYTSGEKFEIAGLSVVATYTDGSTEYLSASQYTTNIANDDVLLYKDATSGKIVLKVTYGRIEKTVDLTITARTSAVITADPDAVTMAAGATTSLPVEISLGGTITKAVTVAATDQGSGHTAVAGDITASVENGRLSIALTADAETGDSYTITIAGLAEDGATAATPEAVTVTVG